MKKTNPFPSCTPALPRLLLSFFCLLVLFLLPFGMNTTTQEQEEQAALLTPRILRFHILANSDSEADQNLKLEVRDLLFTKMYADLQKKEALSPDKKTIFSKQELTRYITDHQGELKQMAEEWIRFRGFSYPVNIEVKPFHFPARSYHGVCFPAGTYDAIRILLGKAEGHNWWCVLYPPLSFTGREAVKEITTPSAPNASGCFLPPDNPDQEPALNRIQTPSSLSVEIHFKALEWLRTRLTPDA